MSGPNGECCNDCKWIVKCSGMNRSMKIGKTYPIYVYKCKRMPTAPEMALYDWCGGFEARPEGEPIYDETKSKAPTEPLEVS